MPSEGASPLAVAYKHKNEIPIPPRKLKDEIPATAPITTSIKTPDRLKQAVIGDFSKKVFFNRDIRIFDFDQYLIADNSRLIGECGNKK